jgi:hypothetical protein
VDLTNDETEFDTFFEFEDEVLSMGWTRITSPGDTVLRPDRFTGNVVDDNTIEGVWFRPGSECSYGECLDTIWELEVVIFRDEWSQP